MSPEWIPSILLIEAGEFTQPLSQTFISHILTTQLPTSTTISLPLKRIKKSEKNFYIFSIPNQEGRCSLLCSFLGLLSIFRIVCGPINILVLFFILL